MNHTFGSIVSSIDTKFRSRTTDPKPSDFDITHTGMDQRQPRSFWFASYLGTPSVQ